MSQKLKLNSEFKFYTFMENRKMFDTGKLNLLNLKIDFNMQIRGSSIGIKV